MLAKIATLDKRIRGISRRPPRRVRLPRYLVPVVAVMVAGLGALYAFQRIEFNRNYRQFVDQNETVLRHLKSKPPTPFRDQSIRSIEQHLEWAKQYQLTGVDPELFEEIKFRREMNRR